MSEFNPQMIQVTGEATGFIPAPENKGKPITVIGTKAIRQTFDEKCIEQALNSRGAPGVTDLVLNPDAHCGYGAPVGCVLVSPTHIYPGPVGVDIKCSMSLLQMDLPADAVVDRGVRRALIDAIVERTPTGAGRGQRSARKARKVSAITGEKVLIEGASPAVCAALGIPQEWASRCEDAFHVGHDDTKDALGNRLAYLIAEGKLSNFEEKVTQLGSYGGGNHFGECEVVELVDNKRARRAAEVFGMKDNCVAFLSHCGSRGMGHKLASGQFRTLQEKFERWNIALPGQDKELVYAPLGTAEANDYLDDMALGANFATVNHLLINALVLEAFQEVIPGVKGQLVYFISHNIARRERVNGEEAWVHRKGATRAFPAGHYSLMDTPYYETGHPILLPGNPQDGSVVMVAEPGSEKSCYSVNHGAGRKKGRKAAIRELDQEKVDAGLAKHDILTNCRIYPKDEAPAAYKDFGEVLRSVEEAGLASTVAKLKARFVIKDAELGLKGAA
jgi:tRNA-splicing ligase RtcB (3'-phosphate/5'-hydroxy nucleic acid ligase)